MRFSWQPSELLLAHADNDGLVLRLGIQVVFLRHAVESGIEDIAIFDFASIIKFDEIALFDSHSKEVFHPYDL